MIRLVEQMVLNDSMLPEWMKGWRFYRIEYRAGPEGCVWLPPDTDPEKLEAWFRETT